MSKEREEPEEEEDNGGDDEDYSGKEQDFIKMVRLYREIADCDFNTALTKVAHLFEDLED